MGEEHISIKLWADQDRPREKMLKLGKEAMTDAELLAILISTGTRRKSALDLAREVLRTANNNLGQLSRLSLSELSKIDGMGMAKALKIISAIEMGGRQFASTVESREKITGSKAAYDRFRHKLGDKAYEEFWIMTLNRANEPIGLHRISEGGLSGTVVDARRLFKKALEDSASSVILAHNHPSGSLNPSQADINLTARMKKAGELLEISVLDHLILSMRGYYSFADDGRMT